MLSNAEITINQAINNRYRNSDKTRKDALKILKSYRGLSPKLDKFVFNDGSDKSLLNIDGTIPVRYKGSQYNIPICIWLLDNHPISSPMVFVKPTQDMLIKPSRHVDQNGKVYLPYLHEWNPVSSDLMGLIQVLIMTFGEMPPVYAKPRGQTNTPGPYPYQQPGYMPLAGNAAAGGLPYPPGSPASSGQFPGYPPNPPSYTPGPTPYPVYPPVSTTGYPQPPPPYPMSGNVPYPAYSPTASNFTSGSGDTTATSGTNPAPTNTTNVTSTNPSTGTITEEHIKASLISAVSDRVRIRFREIYGASQAEASVLRQQQNDLTQGKSKLEGLVGKLEQEQTELDKSIRLLKEREAEMSSVLSRLSSATEPLDIDEAVTTTAPLYKQLLNAYAEDQATQDAIYYLGEALRRDIIDFDTFLKHVRSLSRKQFQLRAIMNKCREKANLAG